MKLLHKNNAFRPRVATKLTGVFFHGEPAEMSDNTTATTTGNGEGLTALLEMAESQLNEGDFLKVANFLKTMHEPEKAAPRIMRVERCKPTIKVQFKIGGIGSGYAATKMEIDVLERKTTIYHGLSLIHI